MSEGRFLTFTLSLKATTGRTLAFSAANLPEGAAFGPQARTFSWTPSCTQSGRYDVTFTVSDGAASDSETARITVRSVPTGDVNDDCTVNVLDLIMAANHIGQGASLGDNWRADLNNDGKINMLDLLIIRNHLNEKCP